MRSITSKTLFLLAVTSLSLASTTSTAVNQSGTSVKKDQKEEKPTFSFGVSVETDGTRTNNVDKPLNSSLSFGMGLKLDHGIKSSLSVIMDKDLKNERTQSVRDPKISLSKSLGKLGSISTSGKLSFSLPMSDSSRKTTSLQTTLGSSVSFVLDASKYITKGLTFVYVPFASMNLHEFETQSSGTINKQYTVGNSLVASYSFTDELSLSLANTYLRNFDYTGHTTDIFSFDQSITYVLPKGFDLTAGHAIGGSALAINGQESNVQLFDKDLATYYISLGFSY